MTDVEGDQTKDEVELVLFVVPNEGHEGILRLVNQVVVFQHLRLDLIAARAGAGELGLKGYLALER